MTAGTTRSLAGSQPIFTPSARGGLGSPAMRWLLAPAAAAWLALLWLSAGERSLALCVAPRATLAGDFLANVEAQLAAVEPGRWAAEWALMIVAMMFPLLVPMVSHVAARSFAPRRDRSVGLFIAGYALSWAAAAGVSSLALVIARAAFQTLDIGAFAALICCALAALWQVSAVKVRAVNRCHGTVALRPWEPGADRDAIAFGLLHGARCVRACLPAMALPIIGGLGLAQMAAVFAILLAERARDRPQYRLSAVAFLLLGLIALPT